MAKRKVLIFTRFERFWHWAQMSLIMTLLFTGFGIHGFHDWMSFYAEVKWHTYAALALLLLWAFAIFWLFTTGAWRHYLPTREGLWSVIRFYSFGVFKGEHHPYRKLYLRKHNPLQALAYLFLKTLIFPAIWISGIVYLLYGFWAPVFPDLPLSLVAFIHTAAAFAIVLFVLVHIYMLTLGHSIKEHVMPMISGFDDVDLSPEEEAYLRKDEPGHIQ